MVLKYYIIPISLSLLTLLFIGCNSGDGTNNPVSISDGPTSGLDVDFSIKIENDNYAQPGGIVVLSANVNRISDDSLSGVRVSWNSENDKINLVNQGINTAVAYIPKNFNSNSFTVEATIHAIDEDGYRIGGTNSKSIDIKEKPLTVENLQGSFSKDTLLTGKKVFQLNRDILLENSATLTVQNGAIFNLNGHSIITDNGQLILDGDKERSVLLIGGGEKVGSISVIEHALKANNALLLSNSDRGAIKIEGNANIEKVKSYITLSSYSSKITDSYISRIYQGDNFDSGPNTLEISNSKIYELRIGDRNRLKRLTVKNSVFFGVSIYQSEDINTNFESNMISYFELSGNNNNKQTSLKGNTIYRLLIDGGLDASIHQNNLGVYKEGFYGINEEPFWILFWFNGLKSLSGPTVSITTSGQFDVQEFNLSNNYWAPEIIEEMNEKGSGQNISFINDYYDDSTLDKIVYKNWSETKF